MGVRCVMKCILMDLFLFVLFSEALVRSTYVPMVVLHLGS